MRLFLVIFFCVSTNLYAAVCSVVDSDGHHFQGSFHRIVSLAPDITETLFAAGAESDIVGVIKGSDYPAAARHLPVVGSYTGLDLERLVALHPDLIIVWGHGFPGELDSLARHGVFIYHSSPERVEDISANLRAWGCLSGHSKQALAAASRFDHRLADLSKQYQHQSPVTVFYQIGRRPLLTINKHSWINQMIRFCGGQNVFADAVTAVPAVNLESVLSANPGVILSDLPGDDWKTGWYRFQTIAAVKDNQLYSLPADWVDRAGPRLVDGLAMMCRMMHNRSQGEQLKWHDG